MSFMLQDKIYMTSDDETEETLALISVLEGMSVGQLCEMIDNERSAVCGFARAARIFAMTYVKAFLKQDIVDMVAANVVAAALQRARAAISNDGSQSEAVE